MKAIKIPDFILQFAGKENGTYLAVALGPASGYPRIYWARASTLEETVAKLAEEMSPAKIQWESRFKLLWQDDKVWQQHCAEHDINFDKTPVEHCRLHVDADWCTVSYGPVEVLYKSIGR